MRFINHSACIGFCIYLIGTASAPAADLLVLANHEGIINTVADAIMAKYEEQKYIKEKFELVMVTYQFVPSKVMNEELVEVVIDYGEPLKQETEKFGEIVKLAVTKRRFVVIMGIKGYVKQITEKTAKSYSVADG